MSLLIKQTEAPDLIQRQQDNINQAMAKVFHPQAFRKENPEQFEEKSEEFRKLRQLMADI